MAKLAHRATLAGLLFVGACAGESGPAGPSGAGGPGGATSGSSSPLSCDQVRAPTRRLVRLTASEYANSVRDVFSITGAWASTFPADPVVAGFSHNADQLLVSTLLADKLQAAAEDIAEKAQLTRFAPCMTAAPDADCQKALAQNLGEQLFRRPVSADELAPYLTLASAAPTPLDGAKRIVAAMLQSPRFLYRSERGKPDEHGLYRLDAHELASELSYLLWQTSPDATLRSAAKAGKLSSEQEIADQVKRMLADDHARPTLRAFVKDWLGLSVIATVPKDAASFPELTTELRSALEREVDRFIDHAMFDLNGSLTSLLTTGQTHTDPALAAYYALPEAASLPDGSAIELSKQERMGILTLGGTMLSHARSNDSSPVQRGKMVRANLLCEVLPPPPPGIAIEPPALDPAKTTRERYHEHATNPACAGCHQLMDPIGFAFEHYDGIGRYRSDDHGQTIDESAKVLMQSDVEGDYPTLAALIQRLAKSDQVRDCYAISLLRFGYGLSEDTRGGCLAQRAQQAFAKTDGSLPALVGVLTSSFLLSEREAEAASASSPDAGTATPELGHDAGRAGVDAGSTLPESTQLTLTVNNDWGAGYCHTYEVKNTGQTPLSWSVSLDLGGTLTQNWESTVQGSMGTVRFAGVDHNAVLAPAASTQFGFCVTR